MGSKGSKGGGGGGEKKAKKAKKAKDAPSSSSSDDGAAPGDEATIFGGKVTVEDFDFLKVIGKGSFGKVCEGTAWFGWLSMAVRNGPVASARVRCSTWLACMCE